MELELTKHAVARVCERFNVKNRKAAQAWADRHFASAQFVANVIDKDGVEGRLFVSGDIGFILDLTANRLVTVQHTQGTYYSSQKDDMHRKVTRLVRQEIDGFLAKAKRQERQHTRMQAELELELAERKLELLRARAPYRKLALRARIAALQARAGDMDGEVFKAKRDCTKAINGAVAWL